MKIYANTDRRGDLTFDILLALEWTEKLVTLGL